VAPADLAPEPFDPATASESTFVTLHAFTSRLRAEFMPDDPPTPLAEAIAVWRASGELGHVETWLLRDGDAIVARGQVGWARSGPNPHIATVQLDVDAPLRRRGLGAALLAPIARTMRAAERTSFVATTLGSAPGGGAWLERMGATRGLETTATQLRLDALDRDLLAAWIARADRDAFELGYWDGPYAEADLDAIAALHEVMGTQPMGALAVAHARPTPAELRQDEAAMVPRGTRRWTAWVRERSSGRFAGFTELTWRPSAPHVLNQGSTGVFPEFRGRGLGAWLKAALLDRVLRERPEARCVRTTNADVNAAMLRINRALGFAPYMARTVWQADLAVLEAWLAGRAS